MSCATRSALATNTQTLNETTHFVYGRYSLLRNTLVPQSRGAAAIYSEMQPY